MVVATGVEVVVATAGKRKRRNTTSLSTPLPGLSPGGVYDFGVVFLSMSGKGLISTHRFLFRAALAAGTVFAWLIVFRLFYIATLSLETSLAGTAALYALSQAISLILTPLSGMALRRGVRTVLLLGVVSGAVAYTSLALLFEASPSRDAIFWMMGFFTLTSGIARAFYYLPYAAAKDEARTLTPLIQDAATALLPALAGFVLTVFSNGPFVLFLGCAALMLASVLPVLRMRQRYEQYDWTYRETMREVAAKKNHLAVGLFILDGVQGAVLIFIWPLAMFLILGSFKTLGAILTATFCAAFLGRYLVRNFLRSFRVKSPVVAVSIAITTWVAKLAVASPVQILAVNIAYASGNSAARFNIDAQSFEQSADRGHFVDEYTAVKEIGLAIGRISVCILFITLLLYTGEALAFAATIVAAAGSAAWSVLLSERLRKVAF